MFESNIPGALKDSCPKHALVTPTANTPVSKLCEVLSRCEMFVEWLQLVPPAPHPHPMVHCVSLLLKPGPLEAILLLFTWRQPHASCWVLFMSCFWTEDTWTHPLWIPRCLTERQVQLRQRVSICCLSVGWHHIRSIYFQNGCIFSWWSEGWRRIIGSSHRIYSVIVAKLSISGMRHHPEQYSSDTVFAFKHNIFWLDS